MDGNDRVAVRPMHQDDLNRIAAWLREPHIARWWSEPAENELRLMRLRIRGEGDNTTRMLTVTEGGRPVGWAQWYRWEDYIAEAEAIGAHLSEVGMDYAIGELAATGRGVGRRLIAALVREIRRHNPGASLVVGPEAANAASRAVLERNGFGLVAIRPVATEPTDEPIAIYRLEPELVRLATLADTEAIGQLLHRFNQEFDEPTPGLEALMRRIADLIANGDTDVVLGGQGPDGLAVLRFRPSIWTAGLESSLAELYITPERRHVGLGRAVLEEAIRQAKLRGADWMSIEVDEPNATARHLYEALGFTNHDGGPGGPAMLVYERDM
jgi:ribosomal protein S18 acetylase RimI-like enzyme